MQDRLTRNPFQTNKHPKIVLTYLNELSIPLKLEKKNFADAKLCAMYSAYETRGKRNMPIYL